MLLLAPAGQPAPHTVAGGQSGSTQVTVADEQTAPLFTADSESVNSQAAALLSSVPLGRLQSPSSHHEEHGHPSTRESRPISNYVPLYLPSAPPTLPTLVPRPAADQQATVQRFPGSQRAVTQEPPSQGNSDHARNNHEYDDQTQRKTAARKKKTQVPTDPAVVALEFSKVEVSTLQARLQKLQVEVNDLKFKNSILMDRNKILEEAKTRTIHDQYFPPQQDINAPAPKQPGIGSARGNQVPQSYSCCTYHSPACCAPPPCPRQGACHAAKSECCSTPSINSELGEKLLEAVKSLLLEIRKAPKTNTNNLKTGLSQTPPDDTLVSTQTETVPTESPTNSLDEFMFSEEEPGNDLN